MVDQRHGRWSIIDPSLNRCLLAAYAYADLDRQGPSPIDIFSGDLQLCRQFTRRKTTNLVTVVSDSIAVP